MQHKDKAIREQINNAIMSEYHTEITINESECGQTIHGDIKNAFNLIYFNCSTT